MIDAHYETMYKTERVHWWYRVRRELVHDLISEHTNAKDLYILDAGCGTGGLMTELNQYGTVEGVDFSQKAVDFCKSRGINNVRQGELTAVPFPDDSFDVVLALDVLEHIENDNLAITELCRVLKPGGVVITFVPTFMFLWGVTDEVSQHFRRYTKPELLGKLSGAGLKPIFSSYFNFILFLPILFARFITNTFKLKVASENNTGDGLVNTVLYYIFNLERFILRLTKLPFGVSCMVIAKK